MAKRAVFAAGLAVFALLVGGESLVAVRAARQAPPQLSAVVGLGPAPEVRPDDVVGRSTPEPTAPAAAPVPSPAAGDDPAGPPPTGGDPAASPRTTVDPGLLQRRTGIRQVALTFDDGPHPQWTPLILDELRAAGVRAMFCVVGSQVRRYPALVTRIVREGHTLCNHSWDHDLELGTRPAAEIRADLVRTTKEIHKVVPGVPVAHFRHPGGLWTPEAVAVAEELGLAALDWDVDPQDWRKPTRDEIVAHVRGEVRLGSVLLLHDGGGDRSATVAALPAVISDLRQRYGITLLGASLSP
ncbi:polysaccharide deacetylase family protein [Solwaraspora sp. WMMD791]|uniref:polysaccharide deacetylase family protein n=1 Tax=Solwaraspora sp. WMMD791 TaxID=3016086 RepID=UPI00249A1813|nr:polysaccharide deacetylase family protein [Solwaraspora sp. WMMD791]WFE25570.1 polysaccharide deacetylase family protein [Solwaraspora sp. WMMD791]